MPPGRARPARTNAGTKPRAGRAAAGARGARGAPAAPDPVAEPLHRGALHLLRLLRREDEASGLSPARLSALSVLVFGGPCSLGALAAAEGVSAPTMSRLVAELERGRWIRRRTDDADARATRIEASAAGRRLLVAGRARRLGSLSAALGELDALDRAALARALPAFDRLVRTLAARSERAVPPPAAAPSRRRRFD